MSSISGATSQFTQVAYTPLPTGAPDSTSGSTPQTTPAQQGASAPQASTPDATTPAPTTQTTNPVILLAHNADGTIGPHHKHVHKHPGLSAQSETPDPVTSVNIHA